MMSWLFSWCHSGPHPVQHYCWECWLKLNYEPQLKKKKKWTRFNALLQTAYSVITYAFPFFPFSCYFLFTCTISEHLQKETDISLSLKTCIGSFNGSKTNIFLLMHTEFLFHLVSASHFKMQVMYWPVKESGQALSSLYVTQVILFQTQNKQDSITLKSYL